MINVETITQNPLAVLIGMIIGLAIGFAIGFIVALRSKQPENNVGAVQVMAIATLFGYVVISFVFDQEVSWVIAIGILATGYGVKGGEILEKIIARGKNEK